MVDLSWSIHIEGTAEELRAQVHTHEAAYWTHMPLAERLAVHHLAGHAIERAVEDSREHNDPARRYILSGNGTEWGGDCRHSISLSPLPVVKDTA